MAGKTYKNAQAQRRIFVAEYLKDRNATQAAIRAGYSKRSAHTTGERLLKNAEVQQMLRSAEADLRTQFAAEAERAFADLIHIRNSIPDEEEEPIFDKKTGKAYDKAKVHNAKLLKLRSEIDQDILDRAGYRSVERKELTGKDGEALNPVILLPEVMMHGEANNGNNQSR